MSKTSFILMIMYDIPTLKAGNRKKYRQVFTALQKIGFYLFQESIYIKPISEKHKAERYIEVIRNLAPNNSHIRAFVLPYKMFLKMHVVTGEDTFGERLIKENKLVLRM